MDDYEIELQKQMCAAALFVCLVRYSRTWLNYTNELETHYKSPHFPNYWRRNIEKKRILSKLVDIKERKTFK